MKKKKDIIAQKQQVLDTLKSKSSKALDVVTSTIDQLTSINEDIEVTIHEIKDAKERLGETENELIATYSHNTAIINKFKALIDA